jgi:NitT/TauT family transport system ATP-binding protein
VCAFGISAELLGIEGPPKPAYNAPTPEIVDAQIAIRGVSKTFTHATGSVRALADCDLEVRPSEFVSVIGPSGCGKSTLLRIVGGLLDPDHGQVIVGGRTPLANRAAKQFGFVPQTPALLPWLSVIDNVLLLRRVNTRAATGQSRDIDPVGLLQSVGLGQFLNSLPKQLSGGMQQRVALVRAFALGAPILLMDEPFAALDEITRASMRYGLLDVWERMGNTVLFVTHSIAEAVMLSDRVAVFGGRPGRVVETVRVPLDRPRHEAMEDTPEFVECVRTVRHALREGWSQ